MHKICDHRPLRPVCQMQPLDEQIRKLEEYRRYVLKTFDCRLSKIMEQLEGTDPETLERLTEIVNNFNTIESSISSRVNSFYEVVETNAKAIEAIKDAADNNATAIEEAKAEIEGAKAEITTIINSHIRELEDRLNEATSHFVTPQEFGAVGDGIADDTAAFEAMAESGINVYIPVGTYLIKRNINLKTIQMIGANCAEAILKFDGGSLILDNWRTTVSNIKVEGDDTHYAIVVDSSHNTLDNVHVVSPYGINSAGVDHFYINCVVDSTIIACSELSGDCSNVYVGCLFRNMVTPKTGCGMNIEGCSTVTLYGCSFLQFLNSVVIKNSVCVRLDYCYLDQCATGVNFDEGCGRIRITNCWIAADSGFFTTKALGIHDLHISGCDIYLPSNHGIFLTNANNVVVKDNFVYDGADLLVCVDVENLIVKDNIVNRTSENTGVTPAEGTRVSLNGTCNVVLITDNMFDVSGWYYASEESANVHKTNNFNGTTWE